MSMIKIVKERIVFAVTLFKIVLYAYDSNALHGSFYYHLTNEMVWEGLSHDMKSRRPCFIMRV